MKKNLITLAFVLTASNFAQAGSAKFTCKNPDGTVIWTRDQLVLLEKDEALQFDLSVLTASDDSEPDAGKEYTFDVPGITSGAVAKFNVISLSDRQTLTEVQGKGCKGGHGPGFITESYRLDVSFTRFGGKPNALKLDCLESSYWAGNCKEFDVEN